MKKGLKILIIVATLLVIVGFGLFITVLAVNDFDFSKLNTENYVTETYDISEDFNNIEINIETSSVNFVVSEDENTKVTCSETDKLTYNVGVTNNTLTISSVDNRRWYNSFGFFTIRKEAMTIYLPKDTYNALTIKNEVGSIMIPKNFTFEEVDIKCSVGSVSFYAKVNNGNNIELETGNVKLENVNANNISLKTATGKHTLTNVNATKTISIKSDTGIITLTAVRSENLRASTDTGRVKLVDVISTNTWNITTSTGGVTLENSDAGEIYIKTATGSVKGSLLTDKVFITSSDTGRINVPKTTSGGRCEIETNTGSINITISK